MSKLGKLVCRCSRSRSSKHTSRKLITLKTSASYHRCLHELRKHGIRPVKSLNKTRVICCHIDRRHDWKAIAKHREVGFVESDMKAHAHGIPSAKLGSCKKKRRAKKKRPCPSPKRAPWNIRQVQAPRLWQRTCGKTIKLAVLDTGAGPNKDLKVAGGVNTTGQGTSFLDDNGHGTHVAGIAAARGRKKQIAGSAPRVKLYAVKVLDQFGDGFVSSIIEGIEWCIRNRMHVINMSLGLQGGAGSKALRLAVRKAVRSGITIIASAGNDGIFSGGIDAPARYPGVIAVAASTRRGRIASFSSRGRGIDITAPGENIVSLAPGGGYDVMSGTSMAAPNAAGGASLLLARHPGLLSQGVAYAFRAGARRLPGAGVRAQGAGLLQLLRSSRIIGRYIPDRINARRKRRRSDSCCAGARTGKL